MVMRRRVFLSVGDISAANYLYTILREGFEDYEFIGITDERLESIGVRSVAKVSDISVVGLAEVLPKLRSIWRTYIRATKALSWCSVLIACDAPGFNMRFIRTARRLGVRKVIYFISPQVWAWKPGRAEIIARYADDLVVILPFEEDLYRKYEGDSFRVHYVGHPLVDLVKPSVPEEEFRRTLGLEGEFINLMPGSRWGEIRRHTPYLRRVLELILSEYSVHAVLPTFPAFRDHVEREMKGLPVKVVTPAEMETPQYSAMSYSVLSLIASGTSSLEAALAGNPHVVFYRVSALTHLLGRFLVKISHISLPNIVLGEDVVPELVNRPPEELARTALGLLRDGSALAGQRAAFGKLREALGGEGVTERLRSLFLELLSLD